MKIAITGATSGIGHAAAIHFLANGHSVLAIGRDFSKAPLPKSEKLVTAKCDVANEKERAKLFTDHEDFFAECEVLINNAGLARGLGTFDEQTSEELTEVILTNVLGAMDITRRTIPFMRRHGRPSQIIHLGSIAGKQAYAKGTLYCASKAAIHMLSEGLKRDLAGTGIRVCTLAPGKVATGFSNVRFRGDEVRAKKAYEGYRPLQAQDIAETIAWIIERPSHVDVTELTILATDQMDAVELRPVKK